MQHPAMPTARLCQSQVPAASRQLQLPGNTPACPGCGWPWHFASRLASVVHVPATPPRQGLRLGTLAARRLQLSVVQLFSARGRFTCGRKALHVPGPKVSPYPDPKLLRIWSKSWSGSGRKVGQDLGEKLVRIWTESWSGSGRNLAAPRCAVLRPCPLAGGRPLSLHALATPSWQTPSWLISVMKAWPVACRFRFGSLPARRATARAQLRLAPNFDGLCSHASVHSLVQFSAKS